MVLSDTHSDLDKLNYGEYSYVHQKLTWHMFIYYFSKKKFNLYDQSSVLFPVILSYQTSHLLILKNINDQKKDFSKQIVILIKAIKKDWSDFSIHNGTDNGLCNQRSRIPMRVTIFFYSSDIILTWQQLCWAFLLSVN